MDCRGLGVALGLRVRVRGGPCRGLQRVVRVRARAGAGARARTRARFGSTLTAGSACNERSSSMKRPASWLRPGASKRGSHSCRVAGGRSCRHRVRVRVGARAKVSVSVRVRVKGFGSCVPRRASRATRRRSPG